MEFGRPSYFQGQPSTSKDSTASSVALGSDETIVGACWTGEKNLLVTSSSSVRVFHVDHVQEPLRTWNFRPDEQHALTSAAVFLGRAKKNRGGSYHKLSSSSSSSSKTATSSSNTTTTTSNNTTTNTNNRDVTPSILSIQNTRTLISWDHNDEALTTLKTLELPVPSNHLLSGFFPDVAVVVGTNGDVHCYDPHLKQVGSHTFQLDAAYSNGGVVPSSKRTKTSRSSSRTSRRRSRSNSNISSVVDNATADPVLEWKVHWAQHAPVHLSKEKTTVLLYVLLRKEDASDTASSDLLVVHELTRATGGRLLIQTLSQHDVGVHVKAATLSVLKRNSNKKKVNIGLQMVCRGSDGDDDGSDGGDDHFQVLTFPQGPQEPPTVIRHHSLPGEVDASTPPTTTTTTSKTSKTSKTSTGRKRRRRGGADEAAVATVASYSVVAISSRHSVIAKAVQAQGGVRCIGWDSGFCVPINELFVPCHLSDTTTVATTAAKEEVVQMMLCPDGVTLVRFCWGEGTWTSGFFGI